MITAAPLRVRIGAPIVLGVVAIMMWHLVTTTGLVPPTFLPAPLAVAQRLAADLAGGRILGYAGWTLAEAALGSLVAICIALPLGLLIARSRMIEAAVSPFMAASQAIPAIAIAPLLVLWVGYGLRPIVILCAALVFFPVALATILGLRTIDKDLIEAAQLDGASGVSMLRHIESPLARPAVLTGLRNGFTLSITGAVVGEFVMGGKGLGMLLTVQSNSSDTVGLFSTLIVLATLAIAIYVTMLLIERVTDPLTDHSLRKAS